MNYEQVLEVTSMTTKLSVVSTVTDEHYTYCDMCEAQESEEYKNLKYCNVNWLSVENGVLCITLDY